MNRKDKQNAIELAKKAMGSKWLVFDFETTGVTINTDRIVSYYLLNSEGQALQGMLNPNIKIPRGASGIHGIYDKHVENKPKFAQIHDSMSAMLNSAEIIIAYNLPYDLGMYEHECRRYKLSDKTRAKKLCAMRTVAKYFQVQGRYGYKWLKLTDAMQRANIEFEKSKAHGAKYDVSMTIALLRWLSKQGS